MQLKQAVSDREDLRARLLQQFNLILETRDTARGLVVNMSDVLFDSGKFTLRPLAREKLAKISGIVLGLSDPQAGQSKATPTASAPNSSTSNSPNSAPKASALINSARRPRIFHHRDRFRQDAAYRLQRYGPKAVNKIAASSWSFQAK